MLRKRIARGVGFKEEKEFIFHKMSKLKGQNKNFVKERTKLLSLLMNRKLKENISSLKFLETPFKLSGNSIETL